MKSHSFIKITNKKSVICLLAIILSAAYSSFGQIDKQPNQKLSKTIKVTSHIAKGREHIFRTLKDKKINSCFADSIGRNDFITFLDALKKGKKNDSSYNGVRVYFTQTDTTKSDLSLLFVPTVYGGIVDSTNGNFDKRYTRYKNIDVTDTCWLSEEKVFSKVHYSGENLNTWVNNFQNHDLKSFENDMRNHKSVKNQTETHSQWYGTNFINRVSIYLTNNTMVQWIKINYAGYRGRRWIFHSRPYAYKLTLVYEFVKNDPNKSLRTRVVAYVISKGQENSGEKGNSLTTIINTNANADTGSPCPPATCSGTSLGH